MTRQGRLKQIVEHFHAWSDAGAEGFELGNLDDVLTGKEELEHPWIAIRTYGEVRTAFGTYETRELAIEKAIEYVTDDICAEAPFLIANLDADEICVPAWDQMPWPTLTRKTAAR